MAKALQCPACGSRHPLSDLPDAPTFRCSGCGRALKVPARVRPASARPGAPSTSPRPSAPDRTATMPAGGGAAAAAGGVAAPPAPPPPRPPTPSRRDRRPAPGPDPRHVAWPFRMIAWLIAVPVGLILVVGPARKFGFLSGQRLLDVLVGTGYGRYWRVLAIAPAWALVTAVLVQLMLVGMRKLGDRRRAVVGQREASDAAPEPGTNSSRAARRDGRGRASGWPRRRGRRR
ncbi:MAG: hypothetical protein ACT4PI_15790 [Actinomycetota bacterium]